MSSAAVHTSSIGLCLQAAGNTGKRKRSDDNSIALSVLYTQQTRAAAATAFLDVLTLQRDNLVTVSQRDAFGEIYVTLLEAL